MRKLNKILYACVLVISFMANVYMVNAAELTCVDDDIHIVYEDCSTYVYEVDKTLEAYEDQDTKVSINLDEDIAVDPFTFFSIWVPNIRQIHSNWCWAATAVATLNATENIIVGQGAFVREVFGHENNVTATTWQTLTGLWRWNRNAQGSHRTGTGIAIEELRDGRPLIAAYIQRTSAPGHMVVIAGYDSWWDEYRIMDPSPGQIRWISARELSPSSSAQRQWVETIVTRHTW